LILELLTDLKMQLYQREETGK